MILFINFSKDFRDIKNKNKKNPKKKIKGQIFI